MLDQIADLLRLSSGATAWVLVAVFAAGVVRGFSGFALSAMCMASLVALLPPIALIPVCWVLESSASMTMLRAGLAEADRRLALGLALGNLAGLPLGLYATQALDPDVSRRVALCIVLLLALLQLRRGATASGPASERARERASELSDEPAGEPAGDTSNASSGSGPDLPVAPSRARSAAVLIGTGLLAGIASGLASIGGMVIALYLLSRALPVATVRASLVLFLAFSMPLSGLWLGATGMLDGLALQRGLLLAPVVLLGVMLGRRLFDPSRQRLYRQVCLTLLIVLALVGLARELAG